MAVAQEVPVEVVAAAVRERGYDCKQPQSVKPDPARTAADEKAWILRCENATYRVRFMGDRGAEVSRVTGH